MKNLLRRIHPLRSRIFIGYLSIYLAFAIVFTLNYLPFRHVMEIETLFFGLILIPLMTTLCFGTFLLIIMMSIVKKTESTTALVKKLGIPAFSIIIIISLIFPQDVSMLSGIYSYYSFGLMAMLSRAKGELRDAEKRIDEFNTETNRYPISQQEFESLFSSSSSINDPFNHYGKEKYTYVPLSISTQYLVVSLGPDAKLDIPISEITSSPANLESIIVTNAYNPTNGIVSHGDIWYLGP
jgi:hypothetical protein